MAREIADRMHAVQQAVQELNIRQSDNDPELVTQQYGFLKFDDYEIDSNTRLSQYIRLALQTDAETVVQFMQKGWCLPTPDLIISVTGGAKNCDMSARLRKIFQRGLVAAAVTTNAWLITAGTNAGVVKEVGAALNNYRYKNRKHGLDVPCIGIGSWGYTTGNDQLEVPTISSLNISPSKSMNVLSKYQQSHRTTLEAVQMNLADEYCVRSYVVKQPQEKRCDLEPNHTHFLLFDDGLPKADNVLPLRADIEMKSRRVNLTMSSTTSDTLTPIVMVLVEGGPSSILTICKALKSNTPVVAVKESGRAADLVADLYAYFSDGEITGVSDQSRPRTGFAKDGSRKPELNDILAKARANNTWVDDVKDELCQVLNERKQLVTIFNFNSQRHHGNLEDAILESLFNAAKFSGDSNDQHRRTAELKLAMAWQKFDYAQKYILTDMTISKWKEEDLHRALFDALRRGHVDFVELLIEFGTSLEKLTVSDLEQLYALPSARDGLPARKRTKLRIPIREDFYTDYFHNRVPLHQLSCDKNSQLGEYASRDLFIWAIFLDRFDLATYFCSKAWNSSVAPLFGALIYRKAAKMTLDSEMQAKFGENADRFDTYATSIIDRCYENDDNFAVDLLKRPAISFYNVDPLVLAYDADCRSFLASRCVQKYLDNLWFGHINYRRQSINIRIFLCSLLLPLLPVFCIFLPYIRKHKQIARSVQDSSKPSDPTRIRTVTQLDRITAADRLRWSEKVVYFYRAPIVRFYYHVIFFVVFLGLFSFVLLVDYFPLNISSGTRSGFVGLELPITEIILHICLWSLICENLLQFIRTKPKRNYTAEVWNLIDIIAIVFYLVGFITRFIVVQSLFAVSKIFLCLDLILWYVRTLHLFAAFERLGPKLVMIFNTMKDLLFFVCFVVIFLFGFSITSWSLITTDSQVTWFYSDTGEFVNVTVTDGGSGLWTWQLFRDVTNYGIWKIFGQVDPIVGNDYYSDVAFVLAIIFVAISNVLLLNVLVALFNVTIQQVQKQSHRLWRYQRFLLINEYSKKPPLPPPFNTIYYMFDAVVYLLKQIKLFRNRHRHVASERTLLESVAMGTFTTVVAERQFKISDAMQRENAIADDYWSYTLKHGKQDRIEVSLQNIERQLEDVKNRLYTSPNNEHLLLSSS